MATGPGKYDDMATVVRRNTSAKAVIVAVIEGSAGNGFSVQGYPEHLIHLPAMLRRMADQIEHDMSDTLTLNGATDDALNSGTYTNTVVDVTVPAGARYPYDFDGMQLDDNTDFAITHTVTITNSGTSSHVFHSLLFGTTEVQTQLATANTLLTNASS